MNKKLVIIGAGGHGKVVADVAKKNGYTNIEFLDDNSNVLLCGSYPVVGKCKDAYKFKDDDFFIAIGNGTVRRKLYMQLEKLGLNIVTLIHPNATIADSVTIGIGSVIMAGSVINSYTKIGKGAIINTCASVDHDCVVGEFTHISIGAHVAGSVIIGNNTWIGAGSTVINNICICTDCIIGAGAVVVNNLEREGTYIGVPARII